MVLVLLSEVRLLKYPHSPKSSQKLTTMAEHVRGTLALHTACEEVQGNEIPQGPCKHPGALLGDMPDVKVMPQEHLQLEKSRPAVMTNIFGRTQP